LNRRLTTRAKAGDAGRRLDEWAQDWLGQALGYPVSRSDVRRFIMAGAVRMEGAPLRRPAVAIGAGRRIEAVLRPGALRPPAASPPELKDADILFEDEWLIAVSKPPGMPTHETVDPRRPHLVGLLSSFLATRESARAAGPEVRLGIHQRLDRDTSGVILFTKDRRADAELASQFEDRRVVKTYHALTAGPARIPADEWSAGSPVSPRPGVTQEALTDFRLLGRWPGGLLVEAHPRTGRKHQIRVHLALAGLPILGDERYGGGAVGALAPRLMLHAFRVELRHPGTGRALSIESPWPADFETVRDLLRAERVDAAPPRPRMSRR
jgi:RluA family pseudouridine synthase